MNTTLICKGRMIRAVCARGIVRSSYCPRSPFTNETGSPIKRGYFCKQCGIRCEKPEDLRAHYLKKHPWALTDAGGEWHLGDPNAPKGAREQCPTCGKMVAAG